MTRAVLKMLEERFGSELKNYQTSTIHYLNNSAKGGDNIRFSGFQVRTHYSTDLNCPVHAHQSVTFNIVQQEGERVVGGDTFVLRAQKQS
jgi:hypothetical protein